MRTQYGHKFNHFLVQVFSTALTENKLVELQVSKYQFKINNYSNLKTAFLKIMNIFMYHTIKTQLMDLLR